MINYKLIDGKLICGERALPVYGEYDVVVVGGGDVGCEVAEKLGSEASVRRWLPEKQEQKQ